MAIESAVWSGLNYINSLLYIHNILLFFLHRTWLVFCEPLWFQVFVRQSPSHTTKTSNLSAPPTFQLSALMGRVFTDSVLWSLYVSLPTTPTTVTSQLGVQMLCHVSATPGVNICTTSKWVFFFFFAGLWWHCLKLLFWQYFTGTLDPKIILSIQTFDCWMKHTHGLILDVHVAD